MQKFYMSAIASPQEGATRMVRISLFLSEPGRQYFWEIDAVSTIALGYPAYWNYIGTLSGPDVTFDDGVKDAILRGLTQNYGNHFARTRLNFVNEA